jgi:Secretion system C-terminal sorting domain
MKKTLLFAFMLVGFGVLSSQAQITITSANLINAGEVVEQSRDTLASGVPSIGPSGASQTWSFLSLTEHVADTVAFVAPGPLPGSAGFPGANIGMTNTGEDSTWMFLDKNPSAGLFVLGQTTYNGGVLLTIPFQATILTFPSTMGTNYGGIWDGQILQTFIGQAGIDSVRITRHADVTSNIDAWGTVSTPYGNNFPSIRQIVVEETIDTTWLYQGGSWAIIDPFTASLFGIDPIAYDTINTARWWTDDVSSKFPLIEMGYENNGTVNEVTWQKSAPVVSVEENIKAPSFLSYPNPTKEVLNIEALLQENASVRILDITGKEVKNIAFTTNKISVSVSDLDNGIYFYTVYNKRGEALQTNKFIVSK